MDISRIDEIIAKCRDQQVKKNNPGATVTFKRLIGLPDARTIASNGGGTPATLTLTPTGTYVKLTCNDTDGCTITLGETGITDGYVLTIVNVTANACGFTDSAGVSELTNGAAASLGQYEVIEFIYVTDRWVERNRGV